MTVPLLPVKPLTAIAPPAMAIVPVFDQVAPLRCGATESVSPSRAASVPVLSKSVGRTLIVPAPAPPQSIEAMRVSPE